MDLFQLSFKQIIGFHLVGVFDGGGRPDKKGARLLDSLLASRLLLRSHAKVPTNGVPRRLVVDKNPHVVSLREKSSPILLLHGADNMPIDFHFLLLGFGTLIVVEAGFYQVSENEISGLDCGYLGDVDSEQNVVFVRMFNLGLNKV